MRLIILFFSVCCCFYFNDILAQQENVWIFGDSTGLDFNSGTPVPVHSKITSTHASASVCDKNGQLLFYTDGSYVWDKNNNLMPNGKDITHSGLPLGKTNIDEPTATSINHQGALIVPMPDSQHKYYVFSMVIPTSPSACRLYYSLVDLNITTYETDTSYTIDPITNDTVSTKIDTTVVLGDVIASQKGILLDSNLTRALSGISGIDCNIWVLAKSVLNDQFKAWEVTAAGVNRVPVVSGDSIPIDHNVKKYDAGYAAIAVSTDQTKIAMTNTIGKYTSEDGFFPDVWLLSCELYDFDAVEGKVVNRIIIYRYSDPFAAVSYTGICFSPDNSKLYANAGADYFQIDISSNDSVGIDSSIAFIGSTSTQLGDATLKLAPNGKIYFLSKDTLLGVINTPNALDSACQFDPVAVSLPRPRPRRVYPVPTFGLPNIVPVVKHDTVTVTSITVKQDNDSSFTFSADTVNADYPSLINYNWDFGDGNTSDSIIGIHVYTKPGVHNVRLIVSNCSSSDTVYTTISVVNGINSLNNMANNIIIYPNPVNHTLFVNAANNQDIEQLSIINSVGQTLYHTAGQPLPAMIDVSKLASGYYVMKAVTQKGSYSILFVVSK